MQHAISCTTLADTKLLPRALVLLNKFASIYLFGHMCVLASNAVSGKYAVATNKKKTKKLQIAEAAARNFVCKCDRLWVGGRTSGRRAFSCVCVHATKCCTINARICHTNAWICLAFLCKYINKNLILSNCRVRAYNCPSICAGAMTKPLPQILSPTYVCRKWLQSEGDFMFAIFS